MTGILCDHCQSLYAAPAALIKIRSRCNNVSQLENITEQERIFAETHLQVSRSNHSHDTSRHHKEISVGHSLHNCVNQLCAVIIVQVRDNTAVVSGDGTSQFVLGEIREDLLQVVNGLAPEH